MSFEAFFERATGRPPYGYQVRLARQGLPSLLQAATGTGKTAAVVLAWLWRRLHGPDPANTPRRLVFALPQRTLVEQVAAEANKWLANLGLADQIALHVVMGGEGSTQGEWRRRMHQPAIVVGTVDSLVSKALNRGYGISRAIYPIDFALVTNGAHWVIDEVQLAPESTTTLRQLAAFTRRCGTVEPFGLTCMSATVPEDLLCTVDNPELPAAEIVRIEPAERVGKLAERLAADRTVRRLPVEPGDYKQLAAAVAARHRPGTLTMVVVNTVDAARATFRGLGDTTATRTLLHSRFRGVDRKRLIDRVTDDPGEDDQIVVSTQVVEAGVDLNASVMVTEAAPWPSLVQRSGRCNRTGQVAGAKLWWLPPAKPAPYEGADVDATLDALGELDGTTVTGEDLLARDVPVTQPEVAVIRCPDLLTLFDTAPDLTGADLDVAPYVRDAEDLDAQVAWATWDSPHEDGRPPDDAKAPPAPWRCRVPLGELKVLLKRATAWRFDQAAGQWRRVTSNQPARPGEVLVVAAGHGGYDPETGFDPTIRRSVPSCPALERKPDRRAGTDPAAGAEDAYRQDDSSLAQPWLTLAQHSEDVRAQAAALVASIAPRLPAGAAEAVETAGHVHDAGKAHPTWQEALLRLAPESEWQWLRDNGPWAKSPHHGRLSYPGGGSFRHELVSMLLLDGPLAPLLSGMDDPDLVRYLALAHHGKLRVQVRGPDDTEEKVLLGLGDNEQQRFENLLGHSGTLTVSLDQFRLGGERSWTRTALGLRERYGPFVLAYLEALVRIADWRASAGDPPAVPEEAR